MQYIHSEFQRISINTEICFGKPCISGTRMPVSSVLSYLSSGMTVEEMISEFDWLKKEDILEALAFASYMMNEKIIPLKKAS
ncbi:MAG: DUF433 domain-containing protein [Bacteroidetes bacterium]|nr:DUF433 domain-containing protein [Bacteroidota bacterium]